MDEQTDLVELWTMGLYWLTTRKCFVGTLTFSQSPHFINLILLQYHTDRIRSGIPSRTLPPGFSFLFGEGPKDAWLIHERSIPICLWFCNFCKDGFTITVERRASKFAVVEDYATPELLRRAKQNDATVQRVGSIWRCNVATWKNDGCLSKAPEILRNCETSLISGGKVGLLGKPFSLDSGDVRHY